MLYLYILDEYPNFLLLVMERQRGALCFEREYILVHKVVVAGYI